MSIPVVILLGIACFAGALVGAGGVAIFYRARPTNDPATEELRRMALSLLDRMGHSEFRRLRIRASDTHMLTIPLIKLLLDRVEILERQLRNSEPAAKRPVVADRKPPQK